MTMCEWSLWPGVPAHDPPRAAEGTITGVPACRACLDRAERAGRELMGRLALERGWDRLWERSQPGSG